MSMMASSSKVSRGRRWASFLVFSVLFILLPIGLMGAFFDFVLERDQEDAEQALIRERNHLLVQIATHEDVAGEIRDLFAFLHQRFVERRILLTDWPRIVENVRRLRGFQIDVYPLSAQGELLNPPENRARAKSTIQRLWRYFLYGDRGPIEQFQKIANGFLGRSWEHWSSWQGARGRLQKFRGSNGEGYLFWDVDTYSDEGGIVFVLWTVPQTEDVVQAGVRRLPIPDGAEVFLQKRSGELLSLRGTLASPTLELVAQHSKNAHSGVVRLNDRIWTTFSTDEFTYFMGFVASRETLEATRRGGMMVLGLLLLIGFFVGHRWIVLGRDAYLSIRIKMVFLFLYALMIPTLGLLTLSYQTFRETERGLQDELRKLGSEALSSLDEGFLNEPERFRKAMNRYRELFRDPAAVARFREILRHDRDSRVFWSLELRDGTGNPIYTAGPSFAADEFLSKLIRKMFCDGIKRFIPHRFDGVPGESPNASVMQGYMVDSLMDSDELGLTRFFESPGMVRRLSLPKLETFFYWDFYTNSSEPAAMINGAMDFKIAMERYLKSTFLKIRQPTTVPMKLFAMDAFLDRWFPTTSGVTREMRGFAKRLWLSRERQFDRLTWGGKTWIAVGIPGKQIPEYSYLALVSEERVVETLGKLKRAIALGLIVTVLLTLLLGWLLSDTLLLPIGELGKGIQAIRQQQTKFRLSHFSKDELGDLSSAFNDMMEHLADLNAGKQVQEQLFPNASLELGGYKVFGVSRPATHLGGDYFDYVRLDDRQFLVLIGDVTGHGIPAALIMAMSKAIILTSTASHETPEEMLSKLNRAIHSVMKGRRLMSMGVAWVRPFDHQIDYVHLGHTFPIIWRATGAIEFVTGTGMPVGTPATLRIKRIPINLNPGDRLVFYTDGLVESLVESSKEDAFGLFGKFLAQQPALPLIETCEGVIRNHPFFATGAPQPDDFTVVMLERGRSTTEG